MIGNQACESVNCYEMVRCIKDRLVAFKEGDEDAFRF